MMTPFKTVDAALERAGLVPEDVSDERQQGNPVFVYLGTNGVCRDDGAHCFTGHTAKELVADIAQAVPCNCDDCNK